MTPSILMFVKVKSMTCFFKYKGNYTVNKKSDSSEFEPSFTNSKVYYQEIDKTIEHFRNMRLRLCL